MARPLRPLVGTALALVALTVSLTGPLAVVAPAPPASAAPGDVVVQESFDGPSLPEGWRALSGSWAVRDGRLVVSGGAQSRLVLPHSLRDFRFEATVRFEQVANTSRWTGMLLDAPADGSRPWWQAVMRSQSTAANGVEIAEMTAGGAWSVPYATSAPTAAGTGRDVRMAVTVRGSRAVWSFDGVEVLEGRIQRTPDGVVGFIADQSTVSFDDVVLTEVEPETLVLPEGGLPAVVAHRGYSSVTPENTLAAVAAGMRTGAEYVEIDVHTSADGVPVVLHDQRVDRTTNGTGDVALMPGATVTALEAGSWFSPAFVDQRVPSFQQVLDLLDTGSSDLLLEIKGPETDEQVRRIVEMVRAERLQDRVLLQSFDVGVLRSARRHAPEIARGLLRGTLDADPVAVARDLDVVAYNPSAGTLAARPSVLRSLNDAGVAVMPYTVNAANDWRRLTDLGVDGIITDRPGALLGWREAQRQVPQPTPPQAEVVWPADGVLVERGERVPVAVSADGADDVRATLDGSVVPAGTVLDAADLALGQHVLAVQADGPGGTTTVASRFSVTVTADGLRGRLAGLDVSTGQLQQLLSALEARQWSRLRSGIETHVDDEATVARLVEEVDHLSAA